MSLALCPSAMGVVDFLLIAMLSDRRSHVHARVTPMSGPPWAANPFRKDSEMAQNIPKPPRGSTKPFQKYWKELATLLEAEGRLNDVNIHCLDQLARLHTERDEMAAQIATDGLTVKSSQGVSAHPLIAHRKATDASIMRLRAQMGLEGKKARPKSSATRHRKPGSHPVRPD